MVSSCRPLIYSLQTLLTLKRDKSIITIKNVAARSEQTEQAQIRLLLKEQSDQGLHRLRFHENPKDSVINLYVPIYRNMTV